MFTVGSDYLILTECIAGGPYNRPTFNVMLR